MLVFFILLKKNPIERGREESDACAYRVLPGRLWLASGSSQMCASRRAATRTGVGDLEEVLIELGDISARPFLPGDINKDAGIFVLIRKNLIEQGRKASDACAY
jgi:hypothetical protein